MTNLITVTIKRENGTSIQDFISEPVVAGNEVAVTCYTNEDDIKVLEAVMFAIDDSELIDSMFNAGYKDVIVNGKTWSLSNSEFRNV